jgi:hypothetical protein
MEGWMTWKRAIRRAEQSVAAAPDDHPALAAYLNNLGNKLEKRFECNGRLEDLEKAISRAEQTVAATPDDHPDLAGRLNNLGNKPERRFERNGSISEVSSSPSPTS